MVQMGSNSFDGVPFQLVVGDRYFHVYSEGGGTLLDVFRWDDATRSASYEVKASVSLTSNIETNKSGIVTFGDDHGKFLFKFRPHANQSQIFGSVPGAGEMDVHITDTTLDVRLNGRDILVNAQRNQISGCMIGVLVKDDGSVAIGSNQLPPGMTLEAADN